MKILPLIFTSILLTAPSASKATAIDISLLIGTYPLGPHQSFFVDITLSGLQSAGPSLLGGWQMDIQYNPNLLVASFDEPSGFGQFLGSRLGPKIDQEAIPYPYPYESAPGVMTIGELSLLPVENYLDPADNIWKHGLDCIQRSTMCDPDPLMNNPGGSLLDSFILARIAFSVAPEVDFKATTSITAKNFLFYDGEGSVIPLSGPINENGSSSVDVTIPEPPTTLLLSVGIIAFGFSFCSRRRLKDLSELGDNKQGERPKCRYMVFPIAVLFTSLMLPGVVKAQDYEILLKSSTLRLSPGQINLAVAARTAAVTAIYAIVQFDHSPEAQELKGLAAIGITPVSFLYNNAWICSLKTSSLSSDTLKRFGIVATAPWLPDYKLTETLKQGQSPAWALTKQGDLKLLVTFFKDVEPQQMQALLTSLAKTSSPYEGSVNIWAIEIEPSRVTDLAAIPLVETLEEGPTPKAPVNDGSRNVLGVDIVQGADLSHTPPSYALSGLGVNIAVSESVATDHPDFLNHDAAGNVTGSRFLNSDSGTEHGTHVAGTIGGNGWDSDKGINRGVPYQWRGMAPEATLISSPYFSGYGSGYGLYPIHVSNHSYVPEGGVNATSNPIYRSHSDTDNEINGIKGLSYQRPHIMAVANQGLTPQHGQDLGYYSIYNPAKNAIGVGAVNTNDASLAFFSSLGPTFDGRIKPDLVAGGCDNLIPPVVPYDSEITVNIDYIRVYDPDSANSGSTCSNVPTSGGAKPVQCWEFNNDGNFEGWFDQESVSIYNKRVVGGTVTFEVKPLQDVSGTHSFGWVKGLALATSPNQFIEIKYSIGPVPAPFSSVVNMSWTHSSSHQYLDGAIGEDIRVDGQSHVVTFPVGRFGMGLNQTGPYDFPPTGANGWIGTLTALRLDPLLPGKGIISTAISGGAYVPNCGTSMSTPAVTGSTALLLQRFREDYGLVLNGSDPNKLPPLPSTIKAVLVQTATDLVHEVADPRDPRNPDTSTPVLYYKGPDYATGYGLVNVPIADNLIQGDKSLARSLDCSSTAQPICQSNLVPVKREVYEFTLDTGFDELKTTIAWDDPAGNGSVQETLPKLVNDIDLVLIDPNSVPHYAWRLTPPPIASCRARGSCADKDPILPSDIKPAERGRDHLNNVEQVQIVHPIPGIWRVLVEGYNLQDQSKAQNYSLANSAHHYVSPNPAIHSLSPISIKKISVAKEDLNADGCIDRTDLDLFSASLRPPATYSGAYDLNGDKKINAADARYLVTKFTFSLGKPCH